MALYSKITPQGLFQIRVQNMRLAVQPPLLFVRKNPGTACGKSMMPYLKYSTPERRALRKPGADSW